MELNGFDHFLFFVICIVLPGMSILSARSSEMGLEPILPAKKHIYFSNGLMLWIGALLVLTNWNLSEKSWSHLGIGMPVINNLVLGLTAALLLIYLADSVINLVKADADELTSEDFMKQVLPENWREYGSFIFLAFSAGVCEEIVYRGFLVNYFLEITKFSSYSLYLAMFIPSLFFAISHLYQGWVNVVKIFSLSLLFCGIFLFSKSLVLVIIIHIFVDMLSGALVVMMAKRKAKSSI